MKKKFNTILSATTITVSAFFSCIPCGVQAMDGRAVVGHENGQVGQKEEDKGPSAFTAIELSGDRHQVLRSVDNLGEPPASKKAKGENQRSGELKEMKLGQENEVDGRPELGESPDSSDDQREVGPPDLSIYGFKSLWDGMIEESRKDKEDEEYTLWKTKPLLKDPVTISSEVDGKAFEADYFNLSDLEGE